APFPSRGVASTANTNWSSARIFRWAGIRCTGEWPWKCSLCPCGPPISGVLVFAVAPAHDEGDAPGHAQHDQHTDDPRQAAVVAEQAVVGGALVGEAVVLGDLGEPVGVAVG